MYQINQKLDIITASKIIHEGLLIVSTKYEIVEKEETKRLIDTLEECNKIYDAFEVMKFNHTYQGNYTEDEAMMIQLLNKQIYNKLLMLFYHYISHYKIELYGDEFEEDNTLSKHQKIECNINYNINKICEKIKSWEE